MHARTWRHAGKRRVLAVHLALAQVAPRERVDIPVVAQYLACDVDVSLAVAAPIDKGCVPRVAVEAWCVHESGEAAPERQCGHEGDDRDREPGHYRPDRHGSAAMARFHRETQAADTRR